MHVSYLFDLKSLSGETPVKFYALSARNACIYPMIYGQKRNDLTVSSLSCIAALYYVAFKRPLRSGICQSVCLRSVRITQVRSTGWYLLELGSL